MAGRYRHGHWLIWAGLLAVTAGLWACSGPSSPARSGPTTCRPADIPPSTLRIGDLEVPSSRLDVEIRPITQGEAYGVHIQLDAEAAGRLADMTRYAVGKTLPVSLGDDVLVEPVVQTPILDGNLLLSGQFTRSRAEAIAQNLSPPCDPAADVPDSPRQ